MWALLTWEVSGANGCFKEMFPKAAEQVHCQREIDAPWLSMRIWFCNSQFVWTAVSSICNWGLEQHDKALWFRDQGCKYIPSYWPYEYGVRWSSAPDVHNVLPSEHGCMRRHFWGLFHSERPNASILLFKEQRFLTGPATSPCQDLSLYVHTFLRAGMEALLLHGLPLDNLNLDWHTDKESQQ